MQKTSVIIIGAGPAGLTAAMQLKRFGISALVFEGKELGGLLHNANLVENYPGFPHGVTGVKLVNLLKKQIERIGVEIIEERVVSLNYESGNFFVATEQNDYRAEVVVIASGTKPRQFDDSLIAENAKSRVFYEVRDLLDVADEEIIIVGAGDAAFDYALNLARRNNRVKILNRGTKVKALGVLVERARENENISYLEDARVKKICLGERGLRVDVAHREDVAIMEASLILGALGRIPNLDFLSEETHQKEDELVAQGILHFVGDVRNGIFRQTAIAAGDGLCAAMKIDQFFKEK